MDEITAHQTARQPFTDISSRLNSKSSAWDHDGFDGDDLKSPDRMSLVTSQISPRSNADTNYLPSTPGPQTPSKRVSTVSAASTILSGRGKRKTHVGPWHLGRTLGEGATGRVRLAKHAITGQEAAIKIVSKKSARMVQSESIAAMDRCAGHLAGGTARPMPCGIEREVVIMKLIEHPNVISLYDIWENRGELYVKRSYFQSLVLLGLTCLGILCSSMSKVATCSVTSTSTVVFRRRKQCDCFVRSSPALDFVIGSTSATEILSQRIFCWTHGRT